MSITSRDGSLPSPGVVRTASERREELKEVWEAARICTRCHELAAERTKVVFGAGDADADLMFIGEAPGANEDRLGLPFVGQAGKLLEALLGEIGLARDEVWICNTLKCRPPGNRDPHPGELENCRPYLEQQLALIQPKVVCTLGNFATKLLRDDPTGITRLRGQAEIRTLFGARTVRLLPLLHPAAALYTPRMKAALQEDFALIPGLLALPVLEQPEAEPAAPEPVEAREPEPEPAAAPEPPDPVDPLEPAEPEPPPQLGLF